MSYKIVNPCNRVPPPVKQKKCVDCVEYKKELCIPECRKNYKDSCRIKPLPKCNKKCPPKNCVRKTRCKFYSVKDSCRLYKPCPKPEYACCDSCC